MAIMWRIGSSMAEIKHKKKWCMKIKLERYTNGHHKIHECVSIIEPAASPASLVGVVLYSFHTDDGGNAVNDKHASTNFMIF